MFVQLECSVAAAAHVANDGHSKRSDAAVLVFKEVINVIKIEK